MENFTANSSKSWLPRHGCSDLTPFIPPRPAISAGSLSAMDILTTLYFNVMQVEPPTRRIRTATALCCPKGHCTPALYPVLSLRGFFPQEDLKLFRSIKGHYSAIPTCVTSRASICPPAPWARASPLP